MLIGLAGTDLEPLGVEDHDAAPLAAALVAAGAEVDHPRWRDPGVDWARYDLVLPRATWDYPNHHASFCDWVDRVGVVSRLENPPEVIRWNTHKGYLLDLVRWGIPTVPTIFVEPPVGGREVDSGPGRVAELVGHGGGEVVVKPAVSCGSANTGRFTPTDPAADRLVERILDSGRTALVQPYLGEVDEAGEVALIFIDGRPSHGVRKGALLAPGGSLVGGRYREVITPVEAPASLWETAHRAQSLVAERVRAGTAPLLYARVDVIDTEGGPVVLEVEVAEPSLFLAHGSGAADALARAILNRSDRARPREGA